MCANGVPGAAIHALGVGQKLAPKTDTRTKTPGGLVLTISISTSTCTQTHFLRGVSLGCGPRGPSF